MEESSTIFEPSGAGLVLTSIVEGGGYFYNRESQKKRIIGTQLFGPHNAPNQYVLEGNVFKMMNIVIKPIGATLLFKESMPSLQNEVINVNDTLPYEKRWDLEDMVGTHAKSEVLGPLFDKYFFSLFPSDEQYRRACMAYEIKLYLDAHGGQVSSKDVCSYFHASEQHLRRRFKEYVGFSPKMYSRIMRFREDFVQSIESLDGLPFSDSKNYYDQSHRIRNFKEFTGFTPGQLPKESFHMAYLMMKATAQGLHNRTF